MAAAPNRALALAAASESGGRRGPQPVAVAAEVHRLMPARAALGRRVLDSLGRALALVLPPLVTVLVIGLGWQLACSGPKAGLPPPTRIWAEAQDLITVPSSSTGRRISASACAC